MTSSNVSIYNLVFAKLLLFSFVNLTVHFRRFEQYEARFARLITGLLRKAKLSRILNNMAGVQHIL